jgi:antibiotic biosynthesis monooxygenase (ABM) superfamily enzyme
MQNAADVTAVAHVIQLAVAPVFLLTGIGAILAVTTNRMARIVDRFRVLSNSSHNKQSAQKEEMAILERRARWVHWAVSLCTMSALFICIVIAALFIGSEINIDPSRAVSLLFISAMMTLISGLLCFLREISLSTGYISVKTK